METVVFKTHTRNYTTYRFVDYQMGTFKVNERPNTFLCHPSMKGTYGSMHIKLRPFLSNNVTIAITDWLELKRKRVWFQFTSLDSLL